MNTKNTHNEGHRKAFLLTVDENDLATMREIARRRFRTLTAEVRLAIAEHLTMAKEGGQE